MAQNIDLYYKAQATTSTLNKRQNDIYGQSGITAGCKPTAQATPTMKVDMKMGGDPSNVMYIGGVRIEETADIIGAWTIAAGTAGQTRYDLLCYQYVYGTTTATATAKVIKGINGGGVPTLPDATYVAMGYVTITGTPTTITQSMITTYTYTLSFNKVNSTVGSIQNSVGSLQTDNTTNKNNISSLQNSRNLLNATWDARDCGGAYAANGITVADANAYTGQARASVANLAAGTNFLDGGGSYSARLRPFSYVAAIRLRSGSNTITTAVASLKIMFTADAGGTTTRATLSILGTDFTAINTYQVLYVKFDIPSPGVTVPVVSVENATNQIVVDSLVVTPIHTSVYA